MSLYQSLHSHTTHSDGLLTYKEVVDVASNHHIETVAFTDHDSLLSKDSIKYLESQKKIKWISGIEMSSGLPKELGGHVSSSFHIIGLFVDPFNKELNEHSKKSLEARIVRMTKIVGNLQNLGFKITVQDCLNASNGESVGRPHIVQAIKSHNQNNQVIEELRLKMEKESKHNEGIKRKYDSMMVRGIDQYPYSMFLSDDAFFSNIYVEYQYWVDMDTCVKLIRNAGGIASVAHYYTIKKLIDLKLIEELLIQDRLDGCEVVFGYHAYGTVLEDGIKKDKENIRNILLKNNKLITGGADAHALDDYINFGDSDWYSKETIGMVEKIIKSGKVDTQFSSYN